MHATFVRGHVARCSKDCAARGTTTGQYMVVTEVDKEAKDNIATICVFASREHADAVAAHLASGRADRTRAAYEQAISFQVLELTGIAKRNAIGISATWRDLMAEEVRGGS